MQSLTLPLQAKIEPDVISTAFVGSQPAFL